MIISATASGFEIKDKTISVRLEKSIKIADFVIEAPGEYELQGTEIVGLQLGEGTLFRLVIDDVAFVYPLLLSEAPTDEQLKDFGSVDVLIADDLTAPVYQALVQNTNVREMIIHSGLVDADALKLKGETMASVKLDQRSLPEGEPKVILLTNK